MAVNEETEERGTMEYKASYAWAIRAWVNRVEEAAISAYVNNTDPQVADCVIGVLQDAYQECRDCSPPGRRGPCDMGYEEDEDGYCVPVGS